MPPSPVISTEAVESPNQKTWVQGDTPSRLFGHARPSQDMSFWCEISTFQLNDQVRVVTRSLSRVEVARGPSASPRLSQDENIIAKNRRDEPGSFKDLARGGKIKDPQVGRLAHAGHGVLSPQIRLPAATDAATGPVLQSTFGLSPSLRLQVEIKPSQEQRGQSADECT